jgi:hypothetical protein
MPGRIRITVEHHKGMVISGQDVMPAAVPAVSGDAEKTTVRFCAQDILYPPGGPNLSHGSVLIAMDRKYVIIVVENKYHET